MEKSGQHCLYSTVTTVDRHKIDFMVGKIPQGRQHVLWRLNVTMDDLRIIVDDAPDVTQTVKISSAQWIDDDTDARSPPGP
jgi:hypothetical protein